MPSQDGISAEVLQLEYYALSAALEPGNFGPLRMIRFPFHILVLFFTVSHFSTIMVVVLFF